MKRILLCSVCVMAWGMSLTAADKAPSSPPASWDEQNQTMGYLVMHLSSINAINGLNLTAAQAGQLKLLAQQIEAASSKPPDLKADCRPDVAAARKVYLDVRERLLEGQEIPEDVRQEVVRARQTQSLVARLSLVETPSAARGCSHCHAEPSVGDVRKLSADAIGKKDLAGRWSQREVFMAHQLGLFGIGGTIKVGALAEKIDRVLTDEQRAAISHFSCCLVPPKDFGDPVRAGQADGGDVQVKILRYIRSVPASQWPAVKEVAMARLDQIVVALKPGATSEFKAEARRAVSEIYDKTRSLSDTEFELAKAELAVALGKAGKVANELNERQDRYMRATFLTVPGAVEAYDRLIRRLSGEKKKDA